MNISSMKNHPLPAFAAFVWLALLCPAVAAKKAAPLEKHVPVVRVNATNQAYNFFHPWTKRAPFSRRGLGAVLDGKRVLVTAELVANSTYLEFENAEGGRKVPATVDVVDYEANLALLKTDDAWAVAAQRKLETEKASLAVAEQVGKVETVSAKMAETERTLASASEVRKEDEKACPKTSWKYVPGRPVWRTVKPPRP